MQKTNLANLGRLVAVLSQIETPSFVRIIGYSNDKGHGEVANYLLNVGISYENAKVADGLWLANPLNIAEVDFGKIDVAFGKDAWTEMFIAKTKPTNATKNRSQGQKDAYVNICPNIRVHKETGRVMIYGLIVSKEVTTVGKYDAVNSAFLTLAKQAIGKHLKTENFRQFAFDKLKSVKLKGETLEIQIG